MKHFSVEAGQNQYRVEAEVNICGKDLNVCIGGGEAYHIGASALAIPRKSLANEEETSASASVFCVVGHKEDELARKTALELSTLFGCIVNVTVGIHIDDATKEDIKLLSANYEIIVNEIKEKLISLYGNL